MQHAKPTPKLLLRLFLIFLKAGSFTFAGGLAMLPLIQKDVIDKNHLMEEDEFLEYAALSQTLPGVIGVNCAVFVGNRSAGILGAIAAALGTILPAFGIMLVVTMLVALIPRTGPVEKFFRGIRAASAALILASAWTLGKKSLKQAFGWIMVLLSFAAVLLLNINAFPVVVAAGVSGMVYQSVSRRRGRKGGSL